MSSERYFQETYGLKNGILVKVHRSEYRPSYNGSLSDLVPRSEEKLLDTYIHARPMAFFYYPRIKMIMTQEPLDEGIIGRVMDASEEGDVRLVDVGNIQAYAGRGVAAIWECYLFKGFFIMNGEPAFLDRKAGFDWDALRELWRWLEEYLVSEFGAERIYAHSWDPLYEGGYEERYRGILETLGYEVSGRTAVKYVKKLGYEESCQR